MSSLRRGKRLFTQPMRKASSERVMTAEKKPSDPDLPASEVGLQGLAGFAADEATLARLFGAAYEELRRVASGIRRNDPNATFSPTDLVHEAWLKLADSPGFVV